MHGLKWVNEVTTPLPFYIPRVEEVLEAVGRLRVISKLDLSKGLPMKKSDICKTAFMCHHGKFESTRMPLGVKNAPVVFQELMNKVLDPCREFARPYMDDIVAFSSCWSDHVRHVRGVLECLRQAGLTANPAKCRWGGECMP